MRVWTWSRKFWFIWPPIVIIFLCVGALWFFFSDARENTLEFELAKATLQVGVVSVAGFFVSLITYEYQKEREGRDKELERARGKHEARQDFLKSTQAKLMDAYNSVWDSRRLMRANGINGEGDEREVQGKEYDKCMEKVTYALFAVGHLNAEVNSGSDQFTNGQCLVQKLGTIETYLNDLVEEHVSKRQMIRADEHDEQKLTKLPQLESFVAPRRKNGKFEKNVVDPYGEVQQSIRETLLTAPGIKVDHKG